MPDLDPGLSKALLLEAKRASDTRLGDSGQKRTENRISFVTQQIEVLAERLPELPRSISAAPIYTQMEKLQAVKCEEEERLRSLFTEQKIHDLPAELRTYEALLRGLHGLKGESKRIKIIEALIHEDEITPEGFRLHHSVGKKHIEGELARRASSVPSVFLLSRGSKSLTNGGRWPGTNELGPVTVRLNYDERWTRKKIDLLELVTLRDSGLTWREIAFRLGVLRLRLTVRSEGIEPRIRLAGNTRAPDRSGKQTL